MSGVANKGRPEPTPTPRVDLHCHSYFSDGEHPPRALAEMARQAGLTALALTDHDGLDGLEEFHRAADGFEPISGVEISARHERSDVHILGLFVSAGDLTLRHHLDGLAATRRERIRDMIAALQSAGVSIIEEHLNQVSPRGTVGRPHLALALVRAGAATDVNDAFRLWLRPGTPGYVGKPGPTPEEAIGWVHDAGGVAVLAHPGILKRKKWIPEFAEAGLDGLEVWHPKHGPDQRERLLELAERLDLVPSGGSDYHGPSVGTAVVGQEPVPADLLPQLRARRPSPSPPQ